MLHQTKLIPLTYKNSCTIEGKIVCKFSKIFSEMKKALIILLPNTINFIVQQFVNFIFKTIRVVKDLTTKF